jgi:hypothetical protein
VNEVKTSLIRSRRIIFTPDVDLKDELANTAIQITCYDRDGNIVKRVTSADGGVVEDPENGLTPDPSPNGEGNDSLTPDPSPNGEGNDSLTPDPSPNGEGNENGGPSPDSPEGEGGNTGGNSGGEDED